MPSAENVENKKSLDINNRPEKNSTHYQQLILKKCLNPHSHFRNIHAERRKPGMWNWKLTKLIIFNSITFSLKECLMMMF